MSSLEAEQRILDHLISHYYASYPKEAVGVIMSNGSFVRIKNWSSRPDRFISVGLNLLRYGWNTWRHGERVVYFYHSHRQSARPSEIDHAFMRVLADRWPHVKHLIFTPDRRYAIWKVE